MFPTVEIVAPMPTSCGVFVLGKQAFPKHCIVIIVAAVIQNSVLNL